MKSIPNVSWKDLQGNKYSKALNPHMLTKAGLPVTLQTRIVGQNKIGSKLIRVTFDREYVINWLIVKVIRVFSNEGLETILDLVREAWQKSGFPIESQRKTVAFTKEEMN